jgi:hypothetical protein
MMPHRSVVLLCHRHAVVGGLGGIIEPPVCRRCGVVPHRQRLYTPFYLTVPDRSIFMATQGMLLDVVVEKTSATPLLLLPRRLTWQSA